MNLESICVDDIQMFVRPGNSDKRAVEEVIGRHAYQRPKAGFVIAEDQSWLDGGANVGAFSRLAARAGARCIAFGPDRNTFAVLKRNLEGTSVVATNCAIGLKSGIENFYSVTENSWRSTMKRVKRNSSSYPVEVKAFDDIIQEHSIDCVKLDIEGSEVEILLNSDRLSGLRQLVFEYHFDYNRSIKDFLQLRARCGTFFKHIYHRDFDTQKENYTFYPTGLLVFCSN